MEQRRPSSCQVDWFLLASMVVNCFAFSGLIVVNEKLGANIGLVAGKYPTILSFASWAYTLWFAIYVSLFCWIFWPLVTSLSVESKQVVKNISQPFLFSCLFQSFWIILWSNKMVALSSLMMLNVFAQLWILNIYLISSPFLMRLPFGLWWGWATWTTIQTISTSLVYEFQMPLFGSIYWSLTSVLMVTGITFLWSSCKPDPAFAFSIAWGLLALARSHWTHTVTARISYLACLFITVHIIICILDIISEEKKKRREKDSRLLGDNTVSELPEEEEEEEEDPESGQGEGNDEESKVPFVPPTFVLNSHQQASGSTWPFVAPQAPLPNQLPSPLFPYMPANYQPNQWPYPYPGPANVLASAPEQCSSSPLPYPPFTNA